MSTPASAQEEDLMTFFLTSLRRNALDSTSEVRKYHPNGILKERIKVMHSHYYAFDIQKEKFLRRTFIKVKEVYNAKGVLEKKDSLAPPEQGHYYENFFDANKGRKKVVFYDFKGNYRLSLNPDHDVSLPKDFEKNVVYTIDERGTRTYQYRRNDPLRYVVHQSGDIYDIRDNFFKGEFREYPNNKYVTFEPRKNYLEVKIVEPRNDSVLCRLKYKYTNEFLNITDPIKIKQFILENAIVYSTVPCIKLYDQRTKKSFILNYNFEKILKEPVESLQILTRQSDHASYFWVCNGKCGLYNLNGKNVTPLDYDSYPLGVGDFLRISTNMKYSCIDYKGNVIIPYRSTDDFILYADNVAAIYKKGKGPDRIYLNLLTGDTLQTYDPEKANTFTSSAQWRNIKSNLLLHDFKVIQDSLAFLELKNPRYYDITGSDRKFWYQKYVLRLSDSLQNKTSLLIRHPDFDPVEYEYVLYNLKTNHADTINMKITALAGNPSYRVSLDAHSFSNGYARLEIMVEDSYERFYSLLSYKGEIVNTQKRYTKIEDVNNGQFIVEYKKRRSTRTGERDIEAYGVINATGEEVVPCEYWSCDLIRRYGYRVYAGDNDWGLIDFEGEVLIKPETTYNKIDSIIREVENPFIETLTINFK